MTSPPAGGPPTGAVDAQTVEDVVRSRLAMALGGMVGDPLNGAIFDLLDGYRALFLLMAGYASLAALAVLLVPRGAGEAGTGPDSRVAVPVAP